MTSCPVRRSPPHPPPASSKGPLSSVTSVLVGEEGVEVDGVVVVVVALDIRVDHHLQDEVEGGHEPVQAAGHLDTPVSGLGGAVREHLDSQSVNT